MGGPSQQVEQAQLGNAEQQTQIAQQNFAQSQQDRTRRDTLQQPAINLYSALTSGDPKAAMTASSPIIGQIAKGYQASKDSIFDKVAPGAGRDFALAQNEIQGTAATSGALASETAAAFDKEANLGAGLGAFSLQELGGSLNAYSGANSGFGAVGQEQAASKASTMGFLGSLVGGAAQIGTAGVLKCWIAEAIYGIDDPRTHAVRAWLNGPFAETVHGWTVMALYGLIGRWVARRVRQYPALGRCLKPLFDAALRRSIREVKIHA